MPSRRNSPSSVPTHSLPARSSNSARTKRLVRPSAGPNVRNAPSSIADQSRALGAGPQRTVAGRRERVDAVALERRLVGRIEDREADAVEAHQPPARADPQVAVRRSGRSPARSPREGRPGSATRAGCRTPRPDGRRRSAPDRQPAPQRRAAGRAPRPMRAWTRVASSGQVQDAPLQGGDDGLGTIADVEPAEDDVHVPLDGGFGDPEGRRRFPGCCIRRRSAAAPRSPGGSAASAAAARRASSRPHPE